GISQPVHGTHAVAEGRSNRQMPGTRSHSWLHAHRRHSRGRTALCHQGRPAMQYYIPKGMEKGIGGIALLVRPTVEAQERTPEIIRKAVLSINSSVGYIDVKTMQERIDPQVRPWKLGATMFLIFAVLALVIAGVGLYSVIAYGVAQRRLEFGIRAALGARAS